MPKYKSRFASIFLSSVAAIALSSCRPVVTNETGVSNVEESSLLSENLSEQDLGIISVDRSKLKTESWEVEPINNNWTPSKPTLILVHGYNPVENEFLPVITELGKIGFQVFLFKYDWKSHLAESSDQFSLALEELRKQISVEYLYIVAHSMGGLVTRRSLTSTKWTQTKLQVNYTTIASPFGGYHSADLIAFIPPGFEDRVVNSNRDIASKSKYIENPGILVNFVSHMKIETKEFGKTRIVDGKLQSDFKANLLNQRNSKVDKDPRTTIITLRAGHSGILSNNEAKIDARLAKYFRNLEATFKCQPQCSVKVPVDFSSRTP